MYTDSISSSVHAYIEENGRRYSAKHKSEISSGLNRAGLMMEDYLLPKDNASPSLCTALQES